MCILASLVKNVKQINTYFTTFYCIEISINSSLNKFSKYQIYIIRFMYLYIYIHMYNNIIIVYYMNNLCTLFMFFYL